MDPISQQAFVAAAGAAASDATYVDDLFSTFVYEGNSSTQTINNGIDLDGEGGLVWFKGRAYSGNTLQDTVRGKTKFLRSHGNNSEETSSSMIQSFNSNGFTMSSDSNINLANTDRVCWTFRKAPGFFDIVTYTGNGTAGLTVSHNLDSVPGMIIVKCTSDASTDWTVYHREGHQPGIGNGSYYATFLNTDGAADPSAAYWNNTEPTSTVFTVGVGDKVNGNGKTYVAYLFAHDDARFGTNEDESVVKCARYTGNGGSQAINLGFEAQWVLIKRQQSSGTDWGIFDIIRGAGVNNSQRLRPNQLSEEGTSGCGVDANGFLLINGSSEVNTSGQRYIYMAIRRPHKPPTAGTDVFNSTTYTGNQTARIVGESSNRTDLAFLIDRDATSAGYSSYAHYFLTRLLGFTTLSTTNNSGEGGGWNAYFDFDVNKGLRLGHYTYQNKTGTDYVLHTFTRAPGVFDVVAYTGNGTNNHQITHNLGVVPEFALFKKRTSSGSWIEFHNMNASTYTEMFLNTGSSGTYSYGSGASMFAQPNSTTLFLTDYATMNESTKDYICYLFASVDGISKVGTYSGTGSNVNVDCGFTAGARFVLIKRTDGSGDWYVWDTARGIVSGNDPYTLLNSAAAEVTNTDYIDPLNAGFTVTSSAPAALNTSGGTYLFLAFA